jgi:hypothetical protein
MCNAKKLPGIEMANWQAERRDSSPLISLLPEQEILTSSHSIVSPKEFNQWGGFFTNWRCSHWRFPALAPTVPRDRGESPGRS